MNTLNVVGLKNSGSFNENKTLTEGTKLNRGTSERWTTNETTYTLYGKVGELTENALYTHEYLVIPQKQRNTKATVNKGTAPEGDAYIYLEYKVGGEVYKTYYGLAQVFGITQNDYLAFNEGWQNTLTITISPDVIEFTGDVAAWDSHTDGSTNKDTSID